MAKMDLEKLFCDILKYSQRHGDYIQISDIEIALKEQGLEYKDDQIVEIKQDSEDERIRKELIEFLKLPHSQFVGNREHEKWIAWLEKQTEQKHFDYEHSTIRQKDFATYEEAVEAALKMYYKYFPFEFPSYEDYVKYLKEKGVAIEVTKDNNPYEEH